MSDRNPTVYNRLATGDIRNQTGVQFADVRQSVQWALGADATVGNASNKHIIRGEFQTVQIGIVVATALNASAKTVQVGTDANTALFRSSTVSGGADFQSSIAIQASVSAAVLPWNSTGSANAVTTVMSHITDVSGVTGTVYVTYDYIVRN